MGFSHMWLVGKISGSVRMDSVDVRGEINRFKATLGYVPDEPFRGDAQSRRAFRLGKSESGPSPHSGCERGLFRRTTWQLLPAQSAEQTRAALRPSPSPRRPLPASCV